MNLPTPVAQACQEIAEDRLRGAHDLAKCAVDSVHQSLEADNLESYGEDDLVVFVRYCVSSLARVRPAVSAIANASAELFLRVEQACKMTDEPLTSARKITAHYLSEFDRAIQKTREHISDVIGPDDVVITVSRSRTVIQGLIAAKPDHIIVAESRPLCEGRGTAAELMSAGLSVDLVVDAVAPSMVNEASLVLVGANAILADGSLVNKVGTYPVGLSAKAADVPLYAACESLKISPMLKMLTELHPGEEIWKEPPSGLSIKNLYLEQVDQKLVSGIITERGLIEPTEASRIATAKRRALKAIGIKDL